MPDHDEGSEYRINRAFVGKYEFDLTFEMLGQRLTRKARAYYEHTPSWEFFDVKKKALVALDFGDTAFCLELLARRQEFHEDGTAIDGKMYWVSVGNILDVDLFDKLIHALWVAIDAQCKSDDNERRKAHRARAKR